MGYTYKKTRFRCGLGLAASYLGCLLSAGFFLSLQFGIFGQIGYRRSKPELTEIISGFRNFYLW